MNRRQRVGRWGEEAASGYLKEHGYEVIARNVRTPYGEIDIVARKEGTTVLIEVKSRTSNSLGPPEIAVTPRKQKHMLASAAHFAQANGIDHWQIDVLAVQKTAGRPVFVHFENAVAQQDES